MTKRKARRGAPAGGPNGNTEVKPPTPGVILRLCLLSLICHRILLLCWCSSYALYSSSYSSVSVGYIQNLKGWLDNVVVRHISALNRICSQILWDSTACWRVSKQFLPRGLSDYKQTNMLPDAPLEQQRRRYNTTK